MSFGATFGGPRYVNIAVEQVKELEETYGISVETIITSGTGGGGTSPISFDVNPEYGEVHTLEGVEAFFSIELTNSNLTVAAGVELSFSNTALRVDTSDPNTNPESGTENNPSYIIEPNSTRTIKIIRGPGAPSLGDPDATCTISYTLSNGETVEYNTQITIEGLSSFDGFLRALTGDINPTTEFLFNGDFSNTGDNGDVYTASGLTATATTSEVTGLYGFTETGATDYLRSTTANITDLTRKSGQDRSWVHIFSLTGASSNAYYTTPIPRYGQGRIINSGGFATMYTGPNYRLDSSHSHSINTNSTGLDTTTSNDLIAIISTWDGSGNLTHYWKKMGDGSGYSYAPRTGISDESDLASGTNYAVGYTSNSATNVKFRYIAHVDYKFSASDINSIFNYFNIT